MRLMKKYLLPGFDSTVGYYRARRVLLVFYTGCLNFCWDILSLVFECER